MGNTDLPSDLPPSRYIAFISYRHGGLDGEVASWLHKAIERYRLPPEIAKRYGLSVRIGRVFRDEEELPTSASLSDQIESALRSSSFLIVVCSPRLPKSKWCCREIQRFVELGRRDRILAIVIDGDPAQAGSESDPFPSELRGSAIAIQDEGRGVQDPMGQEPIAADLRSWGQGLSASARERAFLKIIAGLVGCNFDDLYERDRRRARRRAGMLSLAATGLAIVVGVFAFIAFRSSRNAAELKQLEVARDMAAASISPLDAADPELRALLALEAFRLNETLPTGALAKGDVTRDVDAALRSVLAADAFPARVTLPDSVSVTTVATSRSGNWFVIGAVEVAVKDVVKAAMLDGGSVLQSSSGRVGVCRVPARGPFETQWISTKGYPVWVGVAGSGPRFVTAEFGHGVIVRDSSDASREVLRANVEVRENMGFALSQDGNTLAAVAVETARSTLRVSLVSLKDTSGAPIQLREATLSSDFSLAAEAKAGLPTPQLVLVALSDNGRWLAASALDRDAIMVWDLADVAGPPRELSLGERHGAVHVSFGDDSDQSLTVLCGDGRELSWSLGVGSWWSARPRELAAQAVDGPLLFATGRSFDRRWLAEQSMQGLVVRDLSRPENKPWVLADERRMWNGASFLQHDQVVTWSVDRVLVWRLRDGFDRPTGVVELPMINATSSTSQTNDATTGIDSSFLGGMGLNDVGGLAFDVSGSKLFWSARGIGIHNSFGSWDGQSRCIPISWPNEPDAYVFHPGRAHVTSTGDGEPTALSLNANPAVVALGTGNWIRLWTTLDLRRNPVLLRKHTDHVTALSFHPSAAAGTIILVSGGRDGRIILWSLRDNGEAESRDLDPKIGTIASLSFSPDGRWLVAGGDDAEAVVWSTADWSVANRITCDPGSVIASIGFDDNSKRFALALSSGAAEIWTCDGRSKLRSVSTGQPAHCVAFDNSGDYLIIGLDPPSGIGAATNQGGRGLLLQVDLRVGREKAAAAVLVDSKDGIACLARSTDGKLVAVATRALDIRIISTTTRTLSQSAVSKVRRELTQAEWDRFVKGRAEYPAVPIARFVGQ